MRDAAESSVEGRRSRAGGNQAGGKKAKGLRIKDEGLLTRGDLMITEPEFQVGKRRLGGEILNGSLGKVGLKIPPELVPAFLGTESAEEGDELGVQFPGMVDRDGSGDPNRTRECREGLEELGIGGEFLGIGGRDLCRDERGIRRRCDHGCGCYGSDRHDITARADGRLKRSPGRGDDPSP